MKRIIFMIFIVLAALAQAQTVETKPSDSPAPPPVAMPTTQSKVESSSTASPTDKPVDASKLPPVPPDSAKTPTLVPPPAGAYFYFCPRANAYYPAVSHCFGGWVAVPADAQAPPPPNLFHNTTEETVKSQPNSIDLEFGGRALVYSFDYDRALTEHWTLGIGIANWQSNNWWHDYSASVTVVPLYANYYFSQRPDRGFLTAGVDWINVSQSGYNGDTFKNNGAAATFGGGYEIHDNSGFLLRFAILGIAGRTFSLSPAISVGFGF